MKSISLLASLAALSALYWSAGCSSTSDSNTGAGGSGAGGTSAGTSNGGSSGKGNGGSGTNNAGADNAGADNGGSGTSNAGAGNAGADNAGASGAGASGAGPTGSCGDGIAIEGDPLYTDAVGNPKTAGQGTMVDPPVLPAEDIAVIGNKLFLNSEEEIWMADLTGTNPQIKRIAGLRGSKTFVAGVACADTRFLVVHSIAATADGKLALVDYVGNAVVEITDPAAATCASHYVAGTHASTPDPDMGVANSGDVDGAGNTAMFGGDTAVTQVVGAGIHKIAVDPAGNYYTWDDGTGKVKKIANDAARTVSTIGLLSTEDEVFGLTFLKGKLYAIANNAGDTNALFAIDPTTYSSTDTTKPSKNITTTFRIDTDGSGNLFPELNGSGELALLQDIDNDGTNLIVSSSLGFIWKLGTDGSYVSTLAGSVGDRGPGRLDFEDGFDPTKSHPASEWQLVTEPSNSGGKPWITVNSGSLYWSGGLGTGEFVVKFSCP